VLPTSAKVVCQINRKIRPLTKKFGRTPPFLEMADLIGVNKEFLMHSNRKKVR
jgi:hypothetical protein